jgi:hypothetical protein
MGRGMPRFSKAEQGYIRTSFCSVCWKSQEGFEK